MLTGCIEGKRDRSRQRLTILVWLHRTTGVKLLEPIPMLKQKTRTESYACRLKPELWHVTLNDYDAVFTFSLRRMHYRVLIFVVRCRHNFREIAVRTCEKV